MSIAHYFRLTRSLNVIFRNNVRRVVTNNALRVCLYVYSGPKLPIDFNINMPGKSFFECYVSDILSVMLVLF